MNREAIENLVIQATGRRDKVDLIRSAIDIAIQELSAQKNWLDLLSQASATLALGSPSVQLADDVARVTEVRLINGTLSYPIEIRPRTWIAKYYPSPASFSTTKPCYGYLQGTLLYVVPLPDAEYEVEYSYYPVHPDLEASTDEVQIRGADKAVMAYATSFVFDSIEKATEADRWYARYEKFLMSAKKLDQGNSAVVLQATPRGSEPSTVRPDYWVDPFVERMP